MLSSSYPSQPGGPHKGGRRIYIYIYIHAYIWRMDRPNIEFCRPNSTSAENQFCRAKNMGSQNGRRHIYIYIYICIYLANGSVRILNFAGPTPPALKINFAGPETWEVKTDAATCMCVHMYGIIISAGPSLWGATRLRRVCYQSLLKYSSYLQLSVY